jgi:hypothetical protein
MSVRVIAIPYLVSPADHRRVYDVTWRLGTTVGEACREAREYLADHGIEELHISVNGFEAALTQELADGDMVAISAYHGLQGLIWVALWKLGAYAAINITSAVIAAAITVGVGIAINSIMAPSQPSSGSGENSTYGWGGMRNLAAPGVPIPAAYGTVWAAPHLIGSYRTVDSSDYSMWQYLLMAVGAGLTNNPITANRVRIGEELLTSFENYVFAVTDGDTTVDAATETTLAAFPDTKHDYAYDRRLRYDPRASARGVLLLNFNAPVWEGLAVHELGDVIIPVVPNGYCYECTAAGTSDASEPSPWGTVVAGTTADDSVTWTCRDLAAPADWVANTGYLSGEYIIPTVANGYWYECTIPGTSDPSTEPIWGTTPGGTTTDSSVTWTCRTERNLKVLDSSTREGPWTKYGQAEILLDTPKWGNGYLHLPGTGDYIGTDDYEAMLMSRPTQPEFWFRLPDLTDRIILFTESTRAYGQTTTVTRTMFGYINGKFRLQSARVSYLTSDPPTDVDALSWTVTGDVDTTATPTLDEWRYLRFSLSPSMALILQEDQELGSKLQISVENDSGELITLEDDSNLVIANNDSWLSDDPTDYASLTNKSWYTQWIGRGKYIDAGVVTELYGVCDIDCLRNTRGLAYALNADPAEEGVVPADEIVTDANADFTNALVIQTQSKCDHVRIILEFREGLGSLTDEGEVEDRSIDFAYWYRETGDTVWVESTITCTAQRVTSVPRFQFDLDFPSRGFYDVLLFRKGADHEDDLKIKDISWLISFQEIIDLFQLYPGMQVMVLGIKASDRASGQIGTIKVQHQRTQITVPNWTGVGTQAVDPSVPAYQMLDAVTNRLYGIRQVATDCKLASFADWITWTETTVDGNKRATCNIVYDEQSNFADGFLSHIEQAGRVRMLREGSLWKPVVDKPRTPQYTFSAGNILLASPDSKDSSLQWSGYDETEKVDAVTITWWDGSKYGIRKTTAPAKASWFETLTRLPKVQNVEIRGCNNEDEALRHARFRINKNEYITMMGKHKAGAQSAAIEFGEVFNLLPSSHKAVWGGNLRKDHADESTIYLNGTVNFAEADYSGLLYLFAVGPGGEYLSYAVTGPWGVDTSEITITGTHTGNRGDAIGLGRPIEDKITQQIVKVSHDFAAREVSFEWCEYSDLIFYHADWGSGQIPI